MASEIFQGNYSSIDFAAFALSEQCKASLNVNVKGAVPHVLGLFATFALCNVMHYLLKPFSRPRITSDTFVGMFIGNLGWLNNKSKPSFTHTLDFIIDFGMMLYMFVLGLEMDPYVLFRKPTCEAKVAYAGLLSTFVAVCTITPFLYYPKIQNLGFTLVLAAAASGTASPVLTRLITNLKIGKSDIGRLVIAAGMHTDFIASLVICISYIYYHERKVTGFEKTTFIQETLSMSSALIIQTVFTAKVSPVFMNWVNNENPEGKPLKGSHLVLSIAFLVIICSCSPTFGYNSILSAFMAGIFLPREGRMSKWVTSKINYLLNSIFYPVFFFWVGLHADIREFEPGRLGTWGRLFVLLAITIVGKVAGTALGGVILGFHWPESVALGLLLTAKGHFHIYLAIVAKRQGYITTSNSIIMVIVVFFTVAYGPFVVAYIIKRARKRAPNRKISIQTLDPSNELRILLCLHGPQNVPSTINFMEISRGTVDPGILVYITDMIELTDQIASTLVRSQGVDTVTVTDKGVTEMRDQVTTAVQAYVEENGDGITLRRMLALSTFNCMPQDICVLAEDLMAALIILPFHKSQCAGGTLDGGHSGFRYVNRKVFKNSPCSVGILVDRGFGLIPKISRSHVSLNVAVIFIGGKDDREALAYAKRVARHPGVKLSVIRFLVDTNADVSRRAGNYRVNIAEQEAEMKLDDECFAEFYERYVAGGCVAYVEKHLVNSAETYSTLKSMEGQYSLVVVGRGGRVNSVLTAGMNDWQQCPELGPIGDILSGSDFSVTTSVLIIQQHIFKGELDGLDDDFSIM